VSAENLSWAEYHSIGQGGKVRNVFARGELDEILLSVHDVQSSVDPTANVARREPAVLEVFLTASQQGGY
jgi:hypothetical protein